MRVLSLLVMAIFLGCSGNSRAPQSTGLEGPAEIAAAPEAEEEALEEETEFNSLVAVKGCPRMAPKGHNLSEVKDLREVGPHQKLEILFDRETQLMLVLLDGKVVPALDHVKVRLGRKVPRGNHSPTLRAKGLRNNPLWRYPIHYRGPWWIYSVGDHCEKPVHPDPKVHPQAFNVPIQYARILQRLAGRIDLKNIIVSVK